jgi:capsular polysaccharide transport system permease protein
MSDRAWGSEAGRSETAGGVVATRLRVILALMLRDLAVRFGRQNLGFVWTVLEPMLLTAGVTVVWSMIKEPIMHGVPIVMFVVTGYMPLTLWRHMTNPMAQLLRRNSSMLYHRPISHFDLVVSRMVLEFISTSAALLIVYFVLYSLGLAEEVQEPTLLLGGWLLTAAYYGGMGMLTAAATEVWEPAEKFIQPMQYLALPVSGVFFMVDWLPGYAQKLLLINPSVHCFEMFRAGAFGPAVVTHYDTGYILIWCAIMIVFGVAAMYHVRDRIQTS